MLESLSERILKSLESEPEKWIFTAYTARTDEVVIWISNRPYADLFLYEDGKKTLRLPNKTEIRKAIDKAKYSKILNN